MICSRIVNVGPFRLEIPRKTDSQGLFPGIGAVWHGETQLRSNLLPWTVYTDSSGFTFTLPFTNLIVETENENVLTLRFRATGLWAPFCAKQDDMGELRVHPRRAGHPTADIRWTFRAGTEKVYENTWDTLSWQIEVRSPDAPANWILEDGTWEIGGKASGATLIQQDASGIDPEQKTTKASDFSTIERIATAEASGNSPMDMLPRAAGAAICDFQCKDRTAIAILCDKPGLSRARIDKIAGEDVIHYTERPFIKRSATAVFPERRLLVLHTAHALRRHEARNLWLDIFTHARRKLCASYGFRPEIPFPRGTAGGAPATVRLGSTIPDTKNAGQPREILWRSYQDRGIGRVDWSTERRAPQAEEVWRAQAKLQKAGFRQHTDGVSPFGVSMAGLFGFSKAGPRRVLWQDVVAADAAYTMLDTSPGFIGCKGDLFAPGRITPEQYFWLCAHRAIPSPAAEAWRGEVPCRRPGGARAEEYLRTNRLYAEALPQMDRLRLVEGGAYALWLDRKGEPAIIWCFRDSDFAFRGLATDLQAVRSTWVRGTLRLVAGRVYRLQKNPPKSTVSRSATALRAGKEDFRVLRIGYGGHLPTLSFDDPRWAEAPVVSISRRPGSGGQPETDPDAARVRARIAADDHAIYLLYDVQDELGVQALGKKFNDWVYKDSTVEFFLRPEGELRYVNFEMNCLGTLYAAIVTDNRRDPKRNNDLFDYRKATEKEVRGIKLYPTLKSLPPNRKGLPGKTSWRLGAKIPFAALSRIFGHDVSPAAGTLWNVNFYKCADCSVKPFYMAWQDMPAVNFHDPDSFGTVRF